MKYSDLANRPRPTSLAGVFYQIPDAGTLKSIHAALEELKDNTDIDALEEQGIAAPIPEPMVDVLMLAVEHVFVLEDGGRIDATREDIKASGQLLAVEWLNTFMEVLNSISGKSKARAVTP